MLTTRKAKQQSEKLRRLLAQENIVVTPEQQKKAKEQLDFIRKNLGSAKSI